MRQSVMVIAVLAVVAVCHTGAFGQPPKQGTYKSLDLPGGTFLGGRSSVSWMSSPDGRQTPGNVVHLESWDGATLGSQWSISCPMVVNVQLLFDFVFAGTGQKAYLISYNGGTIWLNGAGPWGGGNPSYTATVTSYIETRTLEYAGGVLVGHDSNHSLSAQFVGYPTRCVDLDISSGVLVGDTDAMAKPATYPSFLDPSCDATRTIGHWDDLTAITLAVIGCTVPSEQRTWGAVKSMYSE